MCGSIPPGITSLPRASITRPASRSLNVPGAATATIRPPSIATSHAPTPCTVATRSPRIRMSNTDVLLEPATRAPRSLFELDQIGTHGAQRRRIDPLSGLRHRLDAAESMQEFGQPVEIAHHFIVECERVAVDVHDVRHVGGLQVELFREYRNRLGQIGRASCRERV